MLGRFPALAGVDLEVGPGEVVLVSGPNGAGKSTLLRLLAGLLPLSCGSGWVLGHDLAEGRRLLRRHVGLLAHDSACYEDLTVAENLRFWAEAAGRAPSDAEAAAEAVGLDRVTGLAFGRLSEGQRRRCDLAVLATRAPELVLLDEPHAGLDEAARGFLDGMVGAWAGRGGAVLVVSHELERARAIATREVHLAGGMVRAPEPPRGETSSARPA